MWFTNISEVLWQGHDRWAGQADWRTHQEAVLFRASGGARVATEGV